MGGAQKIVGEEEMEMWEEDGELGFLGLWGHRSRLKRVVLHARYGTW